MFQKLGFGAAQMQSYLLRFRGDYRWRQKLEYQRLHQSSALSSTRGGDLNLLNGLGVWQTLVSRVSHTPD